MPHRRRPDLTPTLVLTVVAFAIAWPHRGEGAGDGSAQPATQPTPAAATPVVGPIAYYTDSCARCHGDIATPYLGLDHPKRGPALHDAIDMMASGPANAPLDDEGLKQQTRMHEAIFGKGPFVWLEPGVNAVVRGEVLPGTTLAFETGGVRMTPTVKDNRFELPRRPGVLVATRGMTSVRTPVGP